MRVFTASLATETNTFSPMITAMADFEQSLLARPGKHPDAPRLTTAPLWVLRQRAAKASNWQVVEGTSAFAQPAGICVKAVYETLRDEILEQLKVALPVDMVALGLHGAMVADGYDDCEGDMLERVRGIVGPKVAVGAELDPHCHLTERMTRNADVLVCYKESPHTDPLERAEELIDMLAQTALGRIKPKISVYDCRMIEIMPTVDGPMREFVDKVKSLEGKNRVLSISPVHGYTLGDVHDIGTKIMVVTDDDQAGGDRLAEQLGRELYGLRGLLNPKSLSMEEALDQALATEGGPVVIADRADNAGGGSPSDSTYFLRLMIERGIKPAAIGPIWDPIAVKLCFAAGEGAHFDLRLGGKMGPSSGQPVDARVRVIACRRNAYQTFGKAREPLGDAASVDIDGISVALISGRTQALGTDLFSGLGIDPARQKIIVVKSYAHFTAAFAPIAKRILHTGGPGPLTLDPLKVPFRHVRRPIWPLDPEPFAAP